MRTTKKMIVRTLDDVQKTSVMSAMWYLSNKYGYEHYIDAGPDTTLVGLYYKEKKVCELITTLTKNSAILYEFESV